MPPVLDPRILYSDTACASPIPEARQGRAVINVAAPTINFAVTQTWILHMSTPVACNSMTPRNKFPMTQHCCPVVTIYWQHLMAL